MSPEEERKEDEEEVGNRKKERKKEMMMDSNNNNNNNTAKREKRRRKSEKSRALILIGVIVSGSLVYYHCAYRGASIVSLISDVLIVLLCSLAILGLLFRQLTIQVPVDPLEWQISQDTANSIVAWLANTVGAAESVLRVAATGHDKRLFFKVVICLYILSALGRLVSGVTVAYAGLCLFCLYMLAETSQSVSQFLRGRNGNTDTSEQDIM